MTTPRRIKRRTLLRGILGATALVAVSPAIFNELVVSDEIRAFREASDTLSRLAGAAPARPFAT